MERRRYSFQTVAGSGELFGSADDLGTGAPQLPYPRSTPGPTPAANTVSSIGAGFGPSTFCRPAAVPVRHTGLWPGSGCRGGATSTSTTWVWMLPTGVAVTAPRTPPEVTAVSAATAAAAAFTTAGAWLPWLRSSGGRCAGGCSGSGCGRPLLLASLSTSAVAAASRTSAGGGGGSGAAVAGDATATAPSGRGGGDGGPRPGFHLPQLSIMRLPGPPSFAEDQDLAQELLDYHIAKHGGFPRPCPRCNSPEFMVRRPPSEGPGTGGGGGVVEWRSRPLRCETCGCWVHLGCEGVELAEQVPPRPWFHCRACRDTFLRLEAAAERNPHSSSASRTHALYLLTPADHEATAALPGAPGAAAAAANAAAAAAAAASAAEASSAAAAAAAGSGSFGGRGPAGAVLPLLAQGFNADAVQGFGEPAREYDGGKYSAVLLSRGQPVAAATFTVFGAEAQLCLLTTAVQHRLKGNGSALVADLEAALADVGVCRMLVQARGVALPLWLGRMGYELVPPTEAERLHRALPVAYYDCALLQKRLRPPQEAAAAGAAKTAAAGGPEMQRQQLEREKQRPQLTQAARPLEGK